MARIEELLALTGSGERAGTIVNAIQVMGNALVAWSAEPVPTTRSPDFDRRYRTMSEAVALVDATVTSIPLHLIDACDASLDEVRGKKDDVEISPSSYMMVFEAARDAHGHAPRHGPATRTFSRTSFGPHRRHRAAGRGRAEEVGADTGPCWSVSLQRRLAALEQLRKLTAGNVAGEKDQEKAREYRVKLRVVA